MIETTTQLKLPGMELSNFAGVHAMTDVTVSACSAFARNGAEAADLPRG